MSHTGMSQTGMSHTGMSQTDPFGLAALRQATLDGWVGSPTRYAEDAAAERDLVTVGYRDRLFTELAANAADAAAATGIPGRVAVWADGRELHIANTGAPLTVEGVRSLLALRVSAKADSTDGRSVGRFGVGFTATVTVADVVEVRSTTGTVVFDRARTSAAVRAAGIAAAAGMTDAPLLRLGWPSHAAPAAGYDTEIVLHLRDDVDLDALLARGMAHTGDLLLELPALAQISVGETVVTAGRDDDRITLTSTGPSGTRTADWLEAAHGGTRWLVELDADGHPVIADHAMLRAPTPTDIAVSLPARCITDLPLTPDRRYLHPDADIATAAVGYADLVRELPAADRPLLIPRPADARGRDDAALIDAVIDELRSRAWLPAVGGQDLVPSRAVVFVDLTDELAEVLEPVIGDFAHPDVSERRYVSALHTVGVGEIGLAGLAERLIGVERESGWWRTLYAALSPLVGSAAEVEELGTLPIPRADGRMSIGARGLFIGERISSPMRWIPTVDPDALHPLVERLGAEAITVDQALADPILAALVDEVDDDEAPGLADEVLALLAADTGASVPDSLSALLLTDDEGELRPADELLLPGSPLATVLVDDAPFGRVSADLVTRFGGEVLRRIGVGWSFLTVSDDMPVGPDHELPDEELWWDGLPEPPETLAAVRDLDLVDADRWPTALTLLVEDESIAPMLGDPDGYTAWWLRQHAVVDGHPLGWYRAPSDLEVAGARDPLDHPHADDLTGALGGLRVRSAADADTMLTHLADPSRAVSPGVAANVHAAVVAACRGGLFEPTDLDVPQRVRALSGDAVQRAVVLDRPWLLQVLDPADVVLAGTDATGEDAESLAEILDLPTAADELTAEPAEPGDPAPADCTEALRFAVLTGRPVGHGEVRLHDDLWIRVQRKDSERDQNGDSASDQRADWWIDDRGILHLRRLPPAP